MDALINFFLLDANRVFLGSATVLGTLAVIEILSLAIGASLSHTLEASLDSNHNGIPDFAEGSSVGSALAWLGFGKVPAMMVVALFLGYFTAIGYTINWVSVGLVGHALPALLASGFAALLAVPPLRIATTVLARTIPQDFTSAVSITEFVGERAVIVTGDATDQLSAEARVTDRFGTTHHVRVKPIDPSERIACGTQVYLDKLETNVFLVSRASME